MPVPCRPEGGLNEMIVLHAFRGRGRTRIALVDDDPLYREAVAAELEDRGFSVDGFADGSALLAALQGGFQAHVALVDWSLPYMSGLDLLRTMRGRDHPLPVAFLTGTAAPGVPRGGDGRRRRRLHRQDVRGRRARRKAEPDHRKGCGLEVAFLPRPTGAERGGQRGPSCDAATVKVPPLRSG